MIITSQYIIMIIISQSLIVIITTITYNYCKLKLRNASVKFPLLILWIRSLPSFVLPMALVIIVMLAYFVGPARALK